MTSYGNFLPKPIIGKASSVNRKNGENGKNLDSELPDLLNLKSPCQINSWTWKSDFLSDFLSDRLTIPINIFACPFWILFKRSSTDDLQIPLSEVYKIKAKTYAKTKDRTKWGRFRWYSV